jgi:hypothetical protein
MTTTALRQRPEILGELGQQRLIFRMGKKFSIAGINGPVVRSLSLHAALAYGSPGMIEFGPRRGPLRRIMRKVIVGVAAVRLRLWLCLWVLLVAIATYIASLPPKGRPNQR